MTDDYGEPWTYNPSAAGEILDRFGAHRIRAREYRTRTSRYVDYDKPRVIACVNELAGVPDDKLAGYVTRLEETLRLVRSMTHTIRVINDPENRWTVDAINQMIDGMLGEKES